MKTDYEPVAMKISADHIGVDDDPHWPVLLYSVLVGVASVVLSVALIEGMYYQYLELERIEKVVNAPAKEYRALTDRQREIREKGEKDDQGNVVRIPAAEAMKKVVEEYRK